jgi:hypothetical protein
MHILRYIPNGHKYTINTPLRGPHFGGQAG